MRHAEEIGDMADRRLRQPAAGLLLCAPQQRNDRRLLAAFRIFLDLLFGPGQVVLAEGKLLRLDVGRGETANAHRSHLPEHDIDRAENGGHVSQHVAAAEEVHRLRCAKPGARILHLYGLLVPSATR